MIVREEELYIGLMNQEQEVYQQLIEQYAKLLWAVASTILTDYHVTDIEEIVSDVFIRLWQAPKKYCPEKGSLKSYLVVMTRSMALNKLKQNKRMHVTNFEEEEWTEEIIEQKTDWKELYSAIQQLPEPAKEIIVRRFFLRRKTKSYSKKDEYVG